MSTDTDAPRPAWDIRTAAHDRMRAFTAPISAAFAEAFDEAEFTDWMRVVDPDRWIAAFAGPEGTDALGSAGVYPFRLTVPGGEVAAAGVTGVGVRPDHRRRGLLTALMRHQLDDVFERGEPVAILWASEGAIYQRFGYGLATMSGYLEVDPQRTAFTHPRPMEGRMRLLSEDEALSAIPAVYDAMRLVTPGAVTRSEAWWRTGPIGDQEYSRRGSGPKLRYLYEVDGVAEGYAMYRVKADWDHRGPKSLLEVTEVVTLTARALRDVWRFLFDVDLVRTVKAGRQPVPNPLQHLLAEPRALGLVAGDGIWLRLVDLPTALASRRYDAAGALVLEVSDAFCPWNAGTWRIEAAGEPGVETVVERVDAAPDLVLDTADLAAVYLGGIRPSELALAGRIEARAPGAVHRADALFAAERTAWCVSMF